MYCPNCGKDIGEDSQFCPFCGNAVAEAGAHAGTETQPARPPAPPVTPPPPPSAQSGKEPPPQAPQPPGGAFVPPAPQAPAPPGAVPPPPGGLSVQPGAYSQPGKRSALPWILGIVGVAVVAAVVLVLVFVVFKGDKADKVETDTKAIERPVVDFFESLEKQDAKMLVGTMEPDFVEQLKEALGKDYLDLLDEYFFAEFPDDLDFDIRRMDTQMKGEDSALVKVVEGTMSYTDEYGDKVSEEAADADMDAFEVVKVGDEWYLSEDTLIELGFDLSDLEDAGTEDLGLDSELNDDSSSLGEELVELPVDSEDEVLVLALDQPGALEWYLDAENPLYRITDENDSWMVYLYEGAPDGSEIPFKSYAVDKATGEVYEVVY